MCNQRILKCRFCQKNLREYRVDRCSRYVEKCKDRIEASPDLMAMGSTCPVRPELWFTSTTCGNPACQPSFEPYSPSQEHAGLETRYASPLPVSLGEPLGLSGEVPSDRVMSVENEWRSVRPVQKGKTEIIFSRDEKGKSLPPKIEPQTEILESVTSDSPESIVDYTGFYKPYLRWPGAIAPDRDSGLSCPPAGDCLSNVSGRLRSHSLQEGKPGKLKESWNLLTMIKNWAFNDYDPPAKRGDFSPKSSSRHEHTQISNTGSPFFRDLEAGMLGPSFFDYSSDEELDTSFHTARGESSDSTNEAISLEPLFGQETLFEDNEAGKLNAKPRSPMERGFAECRVYGFSGKPQNLPKGRESLLGGDEDKPRRPSPNEPRVSRPCSRPLLERDWELNFSLGASLFYDLVEEQGPTGLAVGGPTRKIGNNKGGQEK